MKLATAFLLLAFAAASPEIRYFRYRRAIEKTTQGTGREGTAQTCVVLDPGIFADAAQHLTDVRLYHDGSETPFAIRLASPVQAAQKSVVPLNPGVRAGRTVFDAPMPEGSYSDLQLDVTGQNFLATVTVSGSQAQAESGGTKLGSYTIFDLTREKLGRSTVLHLPESDFRYLHFEIDGPIPPESVSGLSVLPLPVNKPKYETVAESAQVMQKEHFSILEFTVPAHVPVDRVAFTPGAEPASFSRDVSVEAAPLPGQTTTDTADSSRAVTSYGNLLRVHRTQNGHRIDEERLEVDAPVAEFRTPTKWTIRIDNGDDRPLRLESVRLQMFERNLCFEAAAQTHYVLFYGDPSLVTPHYDYATLFTPQADATEAAAGPEQLNPEYRPRPDERPFTERHPALLWVALVVVIALLGGVALRSAKRTMQTP